MRSPVPTGTVRFLVNGTNLGAEDTTAPSTSRSGFTTTDLALVAAFALQALSRYVNAKAGRR